MEMHTLDKEGNRHFWCFENKAFRGAFIYILKADGFNMVKIGVSNRPDIRFRGLWDKTPFTFSLLEMIEFPDLHQAYEVERLIHKKLSPYRMSKGNYVELFNTDSFDGYTEWFELCAVTAKFLHNFRVNVELSRDVCLHLSNSVNYLDVTWPSSLIEEDPYQHWLAAET